MEPQGPPHPHWGSLLGGGAPTAVSNSSPMLCKEAECTHWLPRVNCGGKVPRYWDLLRERILATAGLLGVETAPIQYLLR